MSYGWTGGNTSIPATFKASIHARDNHTCQLAGPHCEGATTEVDHITPLSEGGTHNPCNLAAVCAPCHRQKTEQEALRARQRRTARSKHPRETHPGVISVDR